MAHDPSKTSTTGIPLRHRGADCLGLLAVFAGGVAGTAARQALLLLGSVPGLAAANLVGCVLLGLVDAVLGHRRPRLRCFLAVGGIGAFTSWSSLAVQGLSGTGLVILAIEVPAGVGAAWLGYRLGQRLSRPAEGSRL